MHFKTLLTTAALASLAISVAAAPEAAAAPFAEDGEDDFGFDDAAEPTVTEAPSPSLAARAAEVINPSSVLYWAWHGHPDQESLPPGYVPKHPWGPTPAPKIHRPKPHGVVRGHGKHAKKKDFKKLGHHKKGHKKHHKHKGHKKHHKGHKKHHKKN